MDIAAVEIWFLGHSLPWDDEIEGKLLGLGVNCVEHLKECTQEEWIEMFALQLVITRRVAARVFASLKSEGGLDRTKCASQLGVEKAQMPIPPSATLTKRGKIKDDGTSKKLSVFLGFSVKRIKKEENRQIRLARKAVAQAAVANVMNTQGDTSGEDIEGGGTFECEPDEDNATSDSEEEEEERAISVAEEDEDEDGSIQGVAYN